MKLYREKNKIHLQEKQEEYQKAHPEVRRRSQIKCRDRNINRGRQDRIKMTDAYIVSLIVQFERKHGNPLSKQAIKKIRFDKDLIESYKTNLRIKRLLKNANRSRKKVSE